MRRAGCMAVFVAVLVVLWAPATGAANPVTARALAIGADGSQRDVAWLADDGQGGRQVYLQHLAADGTLMGSPSPVTGQPFPANATLGTDVSIAVSPTGDLISVPMYLDEGGGVVHAGPYFMWSGDPGELLSHWTCGKSTSATPDALGGGAAAWNGTRFLIASACPGQGLVVTTWTPTSDGHGVGDVDVVAGNVHSVAVASLGADGFVVVYSHFEGANGFDLTARRYTATGTPSSSVDVAVGPGDQAQPTLAASGGRLLAAWVESGDLYGRAIGVTALGPRRHLVGAAGGQNHPSLAASTADGWHLAWSDLRSGNNDVYARHIPSAIPSTPANGTVVAGGKGPQQAPTIAARSDGGATVAFLDQGVGKTRDLTAAGSATGPVRVVTVQPK
jgi:hypothetical protein